MKLKDSELKNILAEVEQEFQTMLKTEQADLKKAAGDDKPDEADSASAGGDASAPAPEASSAPAEASAPEASASASPEASGPPAPEASAPMSPEASASGADPTMGDPAMAAPADPEALKAEYSKLDPESLKAHYMAAKAALFEQMGAGGDPAAGAAAGGMPPPPPAGPEASASASPPPAGPPGPPPPPMALKAEVPADMKKVPANGGLKPQEPAVPDAIKKSEQDEKVADLEKQVELLSKAVELSLGTPMRKAITSVAHLPKTDETPAPVAPTKENVQEKIRKAMGSGKLTKNQKESLFSYAMGNTEFEKIKDLLEVK